MTLACNAATIALFRFQRKIANEKLRRSKSRWFVTSKTITRFAVMLAGERRASDAETWLDHLQEQLLGNLRWPATRFMTIPAPDPMYRLLLTALGFVWAALRLRFGDLTAILAHFLDWAASRDERLARLTVLSFMVPSVWCFLIGGWPRVWDDLQNTGVVVGFVAGGILFWRRMRGITVPSAKKSTKAD